MAMFAKPSWYRIGLFLLPELRLLAVLLELLLHAALLELILHAVLLELLLQALRQGVMIVVVVIEWY